MADGVIPPNALIEERLLNVTSIFQKYHWDCGIACAQMVLSVVAPNIPAEEEDFDAVRQKLKIGKSVWTINLAHIMHHFGVKHYFCTITLGVDPTYQHVGFYTKRDGAESFTEEEKKINELFSSAPEIGINVEKRSVDNTEIINHLAAGDNLAIVLIDSSILRCINCDHKHGIMFNCCVLQDCTLGYQGHFVVLCGFSKPKQLFFFKNPTFHEDLCDVCCCSFENLTKARKSHGTDEDILFAYR